MGDSLIGDVVSTLLRTRTVTTGPKPGRRRCNNQPGNGTAVMALGTFTTTFFMVGDDDDDDYNDDDDADTLTMTTTPRR